MVQSAEHSRRAIILLTDGDDTSSRMKIHDAIERAQKSDAFIYAIGIGDRYRSMSTKATCGKSRNEPAGEPISQSMKETFATLSLKSSGTSASSIS